MNSGAPGPLAVERVKFFGQHRGEVRSSRALLTLGSCLWV